MSNIYDFVKANISPPEHHCSVSDMKQFSENPPADFQSAFLRNSGHEVIVDINFCRSSRLACPEGGGHFSDLLNDLKELELGVTVPLAQGGGLQDHHWDQEDKEQLERH